MPPAEIYVNWQLDPILIGGLLALGVAYALATGPLRERIAPGRAFDPGRASMFYVALVTLFLVEGSPLHDLAERYLLSAHMLQHLLLSYVVARLMLVGVPAWLWRALLLNRAVAPIAKVMLRPTMAFITFGLFFAVWHVPAVYEGALANPTLHHIEHVLFLVAALILWWPILSPLAELPKAPPLVQLVYLFTIPIAQLPVFAAITFSPDVVYATYANAPQIVGWLTPLSDQALAGAIMKVFGLVFFGVPFARIFFEWYARETRRNITQRDMRRRSGPPDGHDGVTTPVAVEAR
ncbi:cytochrome c oxidase assembly factor CtaG [soil metagenome]